MAHEEIYRELAECRASGEAVTFHKWGDDPSIFLVGRVWELSPTSATFELVASDGTPDDALTVPLRLIHTLSRGTAYLWRLQVLAELGPSRDEPREFTKASDIRSALGEAAANGEGVRIWTSARDHDDYLVLALGEETVTVTELHDGGPADGRTVIRLRRIVRLRVGAQGERDDVRVNQYGRDHGFPNTDPRP